MTQPTPIVGNTSPHDSDAHASVADVIAASVLVSILVFTGLVLGLAIPAPDAYSPWLALGSGILLGTLGGAIRARLALPRLGYRWFLVVALLIAEFLLLLYASKAAEPPIILAPF